MFLRVDFDFFYFEVEVSRFFWNFCQKWQINDSHTTEVLDRIAADSDSEVEIESEDDGWPSSDFESSDVDNVRPRIAHEPGRGVEGASMQIR
jgi:hypothetical protein